MPVSASADTEIKALRTAESKTYRADGLLRTEIAPEPVRFRSRAGRWQAIDTRLWRRDGRIVNGANRFDVTLPVGADSASTMLRSARGSIAFRLRGRHPRARVQGSTVRYAGVRPGVSVRYDSLPDGLKETIRIDRPSAAQGLVFDVTLSPGLTIEPADDGRLEIRRGRRTAFTVAAPFMQDALGRGSDDVRYRLRRISARRHVLSIAADRRWLADPSRRYPVDIDPTVYLERRVQSEASVSASAGTASR